MDVRPVAHHEESALFAIHRTVFRSYIEQIWGWNEEWQRENFLRELSSSTTSVVRVNSEIAGYVQTRDEGERIWLQNLALLPAFQGGGIGTRLMRELQERAALRGIPLELGVFRSNESARRFYERLGFVRARDTETHIEMSWRGQIE